MRRVVLNTEHCVEAAMSCAVDVARVIARHEVRDVHLIMQALIQVDDRLISFSLV